MRDIAGEVRTNSWATYSCEPLRIDDQRQEDQLEAMYNNSVPIQYIALKTSREQWTIEMGSELGSGRSVLAARHDDDDDDEKDLAWNNLEWLIGHKTKSNQTNLFFHPRSDSEAAVLDLWGIWNVLMYS